ncbi:hypothetical protein GCM10010885_11920 [Alicyclobacillus cellulosilyticus]|uniref:G domain-containing protein n=1 Tax=Alicyclobacillus cellulosilyticus TaxID=1003997 RepID=A0A917KA27_9BACL|nr:GTPase domain-containing protein [Alicyclobacillus cellulosilyticus]GGJ04256.1 hypothetical protein GCM10010885_11920 [Alicyclobacillus cellulosilyticus]
MNRHIVVGRTGAGKTLFCIRFARFLGLHELTWLVERTDGRKDRRRMSLLEAERWLSAPHAHTTRQLQSIQVEVPRGKSKPSFLLTDTTGLADGIHPDSSLRDAMAKTLEAMLTAQVILHVVDADALGRALAEGEHAAWSALDDQLVQLGLHRGAYLLLANKMDLPAARYGHQFLAHRYPKGKVIPISARQGTGFREVRDHVWRLA